MILLSINTHLFFLVENTHLIVKDHASIFFWSLIMQVFFFGQNHASIKTHIDICSVMGHNKLIC